MKRLVQGEAAEVVQRLAELFRRRRWRVRRVQREGANPQLLIEGEGRRFVAEVMRSAEGRRDRLIPLLAQAILQARRTADRMGDAAPAAIVVAENITPSAAEAAMRFAAEHAPETAVGVVDGRGLRSFRGHGLEVFNAAPAVKPLPAAAVQRLPDLFSDLNQWMLKILLGQALPEGLISVPHGPFRTAVRLAEAAGVSVMSASRFLHGLRRSGFLDESRGSYQIVRWADLLERWAAAVEEKAADVPVRWIIRRDAAWLESALRAYQGKPEAGTRCALGLFAAADVLRFGFVSGVAPHIYMERFDPDALAELGLAPATEGGRADAYVRVAPYPEAVFRAAVNRDGLPVTDILQVWLDVRRHPSRGREQAEVIWRRVLAPALGRT
jgi:hypothetical protein